MEKDIAQNLCHVLRPNGPKLYPELHTLLNTSLFIPCKNWLPRQTSQTRIVGNLRHLLTLGGTIPHQQHAEIWLSRGITRINGINRKRGNLRCLAAATSQRSPMDLVAIQHNTATVHSKKHQNHTQEARHPPELSPPGYCILSLHLASKNTRKQHVQRLKPSPVFNYS